MKANLKKNAISKKLTAKVASTSKETNKAHLNATKSISSLVKWANKPTTKKEETAILNELKAINAKYKTTFEQKNVNKGLLKFALLHETNKVDSNYLPTEEKRFFSWLFISRLLKRKAIYNEPTNVKFVALCNNAKENHIARCKVIAENKTFADELTAQNVDLLGELMTAQNDVLELV